MSDLKVAYVLKRFPRLSETFILNEILELERRGVEIVVYAYLKPNDGRFHAQTSRLRAKVHYLESLDPRRWHELWSAEWPVLSSRQNRVWDVLRESLERGDSVRVNEMVWGAWVASQALKTGVHHIHSHFGTMSSTVAWFAARISGIPFTFTAHAKDIYAYSMSDHRLREKLAGANRVVTVTHFNRRHILEQAPDLDPEAVRVIHNGIDLDFFRPDPSVPRLPNLILSVGRLIPKKGFDDLLEACATLKARGVDFRCMIVGDGPEDASLRQKRFLLGLEPDVEFTGPLGQHVVVDLMHRATVLALPCKEGPDRNRDALPTVLLEALACGLPVVSTDFSGIPEIVESGTDGYLVPAGDVAGMSERLAEILASPELGARFAQAGRVKAERKFDLQRNVGELLHLFEDCVGAHRDAERRRAAAPPRPSEVGGGGRRVLILCADRGVPFGAPKGASVHLREFSEALFASGHAPTVVVAKRDAGSLYQPSYPVHTLPRGANEVASGPITSVREAEGFRNQAVQQLLADLQRSAGFDVVYERYSLFATGGRMLAQKLGVPYVLEVNAPLVEEAAQHRGLEEVELARDVERYLFATADRVVTVSKALRTYVLGVAPQAQVTVVPNGVDIERFDRAPGSSTWRPRLAGDPDRELLIGFVGRVRPWHGVELLVDAMAQLADCDDLRLCIVGGCDAHAELAKRVSDLGLDGRVRFLEGVAPESTPALIKSLDILAAPYPQLEHFYFSPLKVFEYMAAGRAIVASAIGQLGEVLEDGRTALLVPPGDAAALAAAIRRLRGDAGLRERLGAAARAEAAAKHTWARRIETLQGIFDELCARPRARRREATYADSI